MSEMETGLVQNMAETLCCTRREQLNGREHMVVQVVALVPGIVNGEMVTQEEILASVQQWNDVPIPIEHPRERGMPISARQPGVLERSVVGRLYGANVGPTGNLRGEMWLDVGKVGALGYADMLELLAAGGPVEVSTAYYRDLDTTTTGTGFSGAAKNLKPDHLALLPHSKGACSWQDGCGAPRVNEDAAPVTAHQTTRGNQMEENEKQDIVENVAPEPVETPAVAQVEPTVNEDLVALTAMVNEFGGVAALRDALAGLRVNRDNERAALLTELQTNARVTFTAAELATWPTGNLQKLVDALRPADYSGRGGPRTNTQDNGGEWQVLAAPEVK
jgi:hypothetical protein